MQTSNRIEDDMNATITPDNATRFEHRSATNAMIAESRNCECKAYEDIFTYKRWKALGYQVRKGEKGTKLETYAPIVKKDDNGEKVVVGKRPWISTVFCRCQVDKQ